MSRRVVYGILAVSIIFAAFVFAGTSPKQWAIHDMNRPKPTIITPGTESTPDIAGQPPSDAIVLFDGKSFENWRTGKDSPPKWRLGDGYMECVKGAGSIYTVQKFGSCQLHVEWATPDKVVGSSQGRGNSGVFPMGLYEIQVLDSYDNVTYADGQAAAIYGEFPPLVNASRKPGEWQSYDIVFHQPQFDKRGNVKRPATVTLFHNGVLVQDHTKLTGPTTNRIRIPYYRHEDKLPLVLQNHSNPIRYRNIWMRPLSENSVGNVSEEIVNIDDALLDSYVGKYEVNEDWIITVKKEGKQLLLNNAFAPTVLVNPQSEHAFFSDMTSVSVDFSKGRDGKVNRMRIIQGSSSISALKTD